ncbi:rhomboid family intramembrane serine protease [Curtobacterium sp. Leaf261]|uniref:rhomboid family intramembrane serine protease n=1 Tax=Curtobacterium sp. Leaf261 TaxID=1736311 RepID=UPI000700F15E|nr:rhomboid family intramembrane serine protease [Curtobacterium sp. Leaf261]KQO63843.1 Rhomboid family protein [Curtobacterium sp. Leaf261]
MSDPSQNRANYCYRHPDRQSFILCQRCGRTICTECQTPAAVGVHCPECVREQRAQFRETRRTVGPSGFTVARRRFSMVDQKATAVLIAVSVVIWVLQLVTRPFGDPITAALQFNAAYIGTQPWRLLTSLFVHGSVLHILFNMYTLFIFGRMLEQMVGAWRFLALFFLSGLFGSVAVAVLAPGTSVIGASGAIFGLFAAFFVLQRSLGGNAVQLLVIMGLNLVIGFIVPGIAWQAHVGGIVGGFLTGFVFTKTRNIRQRGLQIGLLIGEAVLGIALAVGAYVYYF